LYHRHLAARRSKLPINPIVRAPWHLLLLAALWASALAAYSNSFQAGLVFDSQRVILTDPRIQAATSENVGLVWSQDYYSGTGSSALYRPLTTLSYLWNYAILGNGPNPVAYHWINFLIHAANIALVYLLGLALFDEAWPAFAMAALWGLHPVLTESVTNVVGRADLLAAFGLLAGLLCYVRRWTLALAAAAAIAVFSKESGGVLVAVMIVYDVAFPARMSWRTRAAAYLAAVIPMAVFLVIRSRVLAHAPSQLISFGDNPLLGAGFWTARLTAIKVLAEYLWLLLWPGRLSADYSYNQVSLSHGLFALPVWIAVAAAAVISYRRARPVFFCILFFLVTIAPVSNIFILVGSIMAERFVYLPAIGFAGCLVWAVRAVRLPRQRTILAIVCFALAIRTYARNNDWHNERSLWTSAVQAAPESYKTHQNLAQVMLAQPQPDYAAATREVERAMAILDPLPDDRSLPSVYATAGRCYIARGDFTRALAVLLRGRNIDRAWNDAYTERNRRDGKSFGPVGTPQLYLDLGRVYLNAGQPEKALEALLYGRTIDPQPAFFEALSHAYAAMRQPEQAEISLLEGLSIDSNQSNLISGLTSLYRDNASQSCALNGSTLNVNCPMVHTQLCTASRNVAELFTQLRDPASAAAVAQNAVRNYGCVHP
jgi:protein O-mannosyl-transferase